MGRLDGGPRRRRLLRPRGLQGRRRPAPAVRDRADRRRRGPVAAPPAVPLRDRHAVVGAARGPGHRRRHLARRGRAGARRSRTSSASPTRASSGRTCTTCRRPSTASFDVVYTSRGVLSWLPDIRGWAQVVAHFLAPGGTFFITEIHPVVQAFEDEGVGPGELRLRYPYWEHPEPLVFAVKGSYADRDADVGEQTEHGWDHGLGEIVTALIDAGLRIETLVEHPFLDWERRLPGRGRRGRRDVAPAARRRRRAAADVLAAGDEAGLSGASDPSSRATPRPARPAPRSARPGRRGTTAGGGRRPVPRPRGAAPMSMSSSPSISRRRSVSARFATSKQTWWKPSPLFARKRATPVVSSVGSTSSIFDSPTPRKAIRTRSSGMSMTVSSSRPSASRHRPSASSIERTISATWWTCRAAGSASGRSRRRGHRAASAQRTLSAMTSTERRPARVVVRVPLPPALARIRRATGPGGGRRRPAARDDPLSRSCPLPSLERRTSGATLAAIAAPARAVRRAVRAGRPVPGRRLPRPRAARRRSLG